MGRILIFLLIIAPFAADATVYQWRDSEGNMVYSQTPPTDGRSAAKMKTPRLPAQPPEPAQEELQTLQQRLDELRKKRATAAEDADKQATAAKARKKNCDTARSNLQYLQNRPHPYTSDGKGGRRHMTPDERAQRLEQLHQDVNKYCD